jgi:hypothetical protein
MSIYDIKLSIQLGVPILCGEPVKTNTFSSKSGAKRIFQKCDIPIPVSAYDIYSPAEFETALARLIANNLDVNIWLFKMADEMAPSIVFIDEIDAIGTKRYDSNSSGEKEIQRTMLELLNQLDGFDGRADVSFSLYNRLIMFFV